MRLSPSLVSKIQMEVVCKEDVVLVHLVVSREMEERVKGREKDKR